MRIKGALRVSAATGLALALGLGVTSPSLAQSAPTQATNAIPPMPLRSALDLLSQRSGIELVYVSKIADGIQSSGAPAGLPPEEALNRLLHGTGLTYQRDDGAFMILAADVKSASRALTPAPVETVVVTAEKKKENIQQVPIAITALSQQQLTERQVAGGPDLVKEVPNLTFSKTNFTGYNLEIRGIGTQAISVTTDPAVAVAFNDIPFIRNHFFEQEFYDLNDVEVLRGPQGTLYGRNATAGVVNVKSALPTGEFEAMASADLGNYSNRRLEGMMNIPLVGDKLDLRIAGEWTKRDGYSVNELTGMPIDGRDLWSGRATLGFKPSENLQMSLVWEHFQEHDDRMRTAKQLCKTAPIPSSVLGVAVTEFGGTSSEGDYLSQGCEMSSLYSPSAFEVPNGFSLGYYSGLLGATAGELRPGFDVYASTTQSTNLRDIQATIDPAYRAKNDTLELNVDYRITPALTLTSQTGYNHDFLWSTEDYNRFNSAPGIFQCTGPAGGCGPGEVLQPDPLAGKNGVPADSAVFCDPQLGCSDRLAAQDLSEEHAWQLSQEFRLASNFSGPLNFSFGVNYLHYETEENYFVFINTLNMFAFRDYLNGNLSAVHPSAVNLSSYVPGVTDNSLCISGQSGYRQFNPARPEEVLDCIYADPNPITSLNGQGHNYFLSQNPYTLNSYAGFGEVYYDLQKDLKLTGGLRWTNDQKRFIEIPSELLVSETYGYTTSGILDQQWSQLTGRAALDWTPKLDFTDQTLMYASFAHGYKAGGANPPGASYPFTCESGNCKDVTTNPIHPLTFKPEFVESFELGTKNTLLDNALTLNGDVFYYNYTGYQISEIVDRSAINLNFNAHVEGAELQADWEPLPGLKFSLGQGYERTALAGGSQAVDLMDRTAGNPNWMVVKPFVTEASNCILPTYVVSALLALGGANMASACDQAYSGHVDPVSRGPYVPNPTNFFGGGAICPPACNYAGFDPLAGTKEDPYTDQNLDNGINYGPVQNNGQGFDKNLSGKQLPNAPHFTTSLTAEYTMPVSENWAATLHTDFYWQSQSWARVFNDNPYDKIHGYSNVNLSLILTSADGWQVMGYVKNVFNVTAITGDFLNSDDTGLTTNVFLTDPRLFGVRVTKEFGQGDTGAMKDVEDFISGLFTDTDNGRPPLWITLGGGLAQFDNQQRAFSPSWLSAVTIPAQKNTLDAQPPLKNGLEEEAKLSYQPVDSDWIIAASVRFGRSSAIRQHHQQTPNAKIPINEHFTGYFAHYFGTQKHYDLYPYSHVKFADGSGRKSEHHLILDFQAGKDVGLGAMGASSVVSAGVRYVQFLSKENVTLRAIPDLRYPTAPVSGTNYAVLQAVNTLKSSPINFHAYTGISQIQRSFRGVGPSLSWAASLPVAGQRDSGELAFDWGLNVAALFGRQRVRGQHSTETISYHGSHWNPQGAPIPPNNGVPVKAGSFFGTGTQFVPPLRQVNSVQIDRSRSVTVPDIGGSIGFTFKMQNVKASFGYRGDIFLGAMDGGIDTYKAYNRDFYGPYANISIGFGG